MTILKIPANHKGSRGHQPSPAAFGPLPERRAAVAGRAPLSMPEEV